jgi:site-specific recombinase XerC
MSMLDTYFAQFVRERIYLNNVTPKTQEWYETAWKAFTRFQTTEPPRLPDAPLITRTDLQRFVVHLRERRVKAVSCNSWLGAMNAFCAWLHAQGIVAEPLPHSPGRVIEEIDKPFGALNICGILNAPCYLDVENFDLLNQFQPSSACPLCDERR